MTILQAVVLGLIQGLTEFIPISSSGHLEIIPVLLGWGDPGTAVTAVIQLGTLLAVIIYFFKDIVRMIAGFVRGLVTRKPFDDPDSREAWMVGLGTIPIVFFGLVFKDQIETVLRSLWVVTFMVIAVAILMEIAERMCIRRTLRDQLTIKDAVIIGLGQCLALIPGASRSGSTIMTALFRGIDRSAAARFSFLLSIPAIAGAAILQAVDEREHLATLGATPIAVAIFVAFVSGWASIWFLLRFLRTHTTRVFIIYRLILGAVMIGLLATGTIAANH